MQSFGSIRRVKLANEIRLPQWKLLEPVCSRPDISEKQTVDVALFLRTSTFKVWRRWVLKAENSKKAQRPSVDSV